MGFFAKLKSAGSYVFNFKVNKWIGADQLKDSTRNILTLGSNLFTPEQANYNETFEEALARLNVTQQQLQQRVKEFTMLLIIFSCIAIAIFSYSIYIAFEYKNFMGFLMGFAMTLYALTYVFRYHFWIYQIKHRKLGCSLKDWFLDKP